MHKIAVRKLDTDVLVVGGGLAGLMTAIRARELGAEVLVVDKAKVAKSGCSPFAAGIYNAVLPEDDPVLWAKEVIEAGDFLNDQEWVSQHARLSYPIITMIDNWGKEQNLTVFERETNGNFVRRKSRGHIYSSHCVVNSLPMMEALWRQAKDRQVGFLERTMVTDLVKDNGAVIGALGFNHRTGHIYELRARSTVLAAGGCGFKSIFIGHKNLTGDLKAAALRAGAVFKSMEQFESNTCYKGFDIHGMNLMINVGGRFINGRGEEFMPRYDPKLGNRALLSELALAFCQEVKAGRGPIYLDVTAASPEDRKLCRKILPETFKAWDRAVRGRRHDLCPLGRIGPGGDSVILCLHLRVQGGRNGRAGCQLKKRRSGQDRALAGKGAAACPSYYPHQGAEPG
jgi:succinate dehydrogenase/fumarate reductase flavoprotein subunit